MSSTAALSFKKDAIGKNTMADIKLLIDNKIAFFYDVIQKTILHVQTNKASGILSVGDVNSCMNNLHIMSRQLKNICLMLDSALVDTSDVVNKLQELNNDLSNVLKIFGTQSFEDFLLVCFGNNSSNLYAISDMDKHKFILLKTYFHPINYRILPTNILKPAPSSGDADATDPPKSIHIDECVLNEKSKNLDCIDIGTKHSAFHLRVFGVQLIIHNPQQNQSLIITGFVDDIMIDFLNNKFLLMKSAAIRENAPKTPDFLTNSFSVFINSLNIKDYLICEPHEVYMKYVGYLSNLNTIRQKSIAQVIKEFISADLFMKRTILIQLLIKSEFCDNQYLAYLLYDLLSNDANNTIDTHDQMILFDSFPLHIKNNFKDAMNKTVQYTNDLTNFDIQKIPLEQQICLLKASETVKEKAMQKLKEVKSKSDDSGSKARQYLDGLLKIPFNVIRREPILNIMNAIRGEHATLVPNSGTHGSKKEFTSLEIRKSIQDINIVSDKVKLVVTNIEKSLHNCSKKELCEYIDAINFVSSESKKNEIVCLKCKHKTKEHIIVAIQLFVAKCQDIDMLRDIFNQPEQEGHHNADCSFKMETVKKIESKYAEIDRYMKGVKTSLDVSVHGHTDAKRQIERIIGQWINGKADGYCFGFEGPPGVGKTSLAKNGLSNCLRDGDGVSRPFAMIQMGGDANGSSLHGHNYTYVGSTWGSIVQILIDKKCMNPIIFIDEIDKISKTEHGKEIIGILTHLLDSTQNDCFQDKYFSGIDLDLSKALFVLSYNDAAAIDKILLDRIHRIRFKNLTLTEKLVIAEKHILPEIYDKMGMASMIDFSKDVLRFVINSYTCEPGVRKLKQVLFEIIGEINLEILKNADVGDIPIVVTIDKIKMGYFKDKQMIKPVLVHDSPKSGIITGLWANAMGQGGVIPIQVKWKPSAQFLDLQLTGMQGDVMKESMRVALTQAWNLTDKDVQQKIIANYKKDNMGIHVHCPEGATPKDGPSAGTAITVAIYSLLNDLKIKNTVAITGETTLDGKVTEIGGLDLKIVGGIRAGVTHFIFPKDNVKDYNDFIDKYGGDADIGKIKFSSVETLLDVLPMVFV